MDRKIHWLLNGFKNNEWTGRAGNEERGKISSTVQLIYTQTAEREILKCRRKTLLNIFASLKVQEFILSASKKYCSLYMTPLPWSCSANTSKNMHVEDLTSK